MENILDNEELMNERLLAANKALIDGYANLDKDDEHYAQKLLDLTTAHKQILEDYDKYRSSLAKDRELDIAEDSNEIETAKLEEATLTHKREHRREISRQGVWIGTTLFSGLLGAWMYKRSTNKEADEAILSQTDQTVVKSGLSSIFKGFGFGGNKML